MEGKGGGGVRHVTLLDDHGIEMGVNRVDALCNIFRSKMLIGELDSNNLPYKKQVSKQNRGYLPSTSKRPSYALLSSLLINSSILKL